MHFRDFADNVVEAVFPYRCISCGLILDSEYLCRKCLTQIPIRKTLECIGCKRPVKGGETCRLCRKSFFIDQLYICSDYDNPVVKKSIAVFKYQFIPEMSLPLVGIILKYAKQIQRLKKLSIFGDNPFLISVPLHSRRLNWRGFNQSELISSQLASELKLPTNSELIERNRYTLTQVDLEDRELRLNNIKDCFKVIETDKIKGRKMLLIDDVCTTGGTLNECAKVLKSAGAEKVSALVIARG